MLAQEAFEQTPTLNGCSRVEIECELERLLNDPYFSHSQRFPSFLRFVVTEALEGRDAALKERTIGVEVFGRDPDYDTTADPIVRVTAAEIRKRIAQYYQKPGHEESLRISMPVGGYAPSFHQTNTSPAAKAESLTSDEQQLATETTLPLVFASTDEARRETKIFRGKNWRLLVLCASLLVAAGSTVGWLWFHSRPSSLQSFWAPILSSPDPVLLCVADRYVTNPAPEKSLRTPVGMVVIDDLETLTKIAGVLQANDHRFHLRGGNTLSLTDLRQGPSIFIGAFDNAWTLRLVRGLRFYFDGGSGLKRFWIEDAQSPEHSRWMVDAEQVQSNNYTDYAIVARFVDNNTGELTAIAAGLSRGGTVAAGEFLTQVGNLDKLAVNAPKNWAGGNIEVVLSTQIIDGRSAPPQIVAMYFW